VDSDVRRRHVRHSRCAHRNAGARQRRRRPASCPAARIHGRSAKSVRCAHRRARRAPVVGLWPLASGLWPFFCMNISEIARRANVSTATVSRTLNQSGPVKAATARKVWRAVTELNYVPNSHARALVSGRSRMLGVIVSDITNPFFPELLKSFELRAADKQYDLIVTSTDYETSRMSACLRRLLERKVDGVAMMTSEMDLGLIRELSSRGVPMVFMDVGQVGPKMSH